MLNFILILYFSVAMLGIFLLIRLYSKKPARLVTGIIHGSLGLLGLALFIGYMSFQKGDVPVTGFFFLLFAFFFGGGMIATTLSGKKYPKLILFIHIAFALTGLYLLFTFGLSKL
ncbi:MAG TPA: hypothetical protein PKA90_02065 [Ignavibacteria bacterium]|nr:hypothetical protein [Ignavibacteria bacterium]HMR39193.1 hypothetical protein [Ignavibacteria bacterium]